MNELAPLGRGIEVTPTALSVSDDLAFDEFERALAAASALGDSARWWLGDLLLFGEARYGEEYAQALSAARVTERQLGRYRYVCQQIARSRRRKNLPFSHHEEVAALEPADQDRLLGQAEREGWSVALLRDRAREVRDVERARPGRAEVVPGQGPVDAARGVAAARRTLSTLRESLAPETAETLGLTEALAGLDDVGRAIRDLGPAFSLAQAVGRALDAGVQQRGLADPAYIVPSAPWEAMADAYERAREKR